MLMFEVIVFAFFFLLDVMYFGIMFLIREIESDQTTFYSFVRFGFNGSTIWFGLKNFLNH